jgi:hypothetical protein
MTVHFTKLANLYVDISRESAITRIKLKCGEIEASQLLQTRWHIVN